jgi:hypothetical protein
MSGRQRGILDCPPALRRTLPRSDISVFEVVFDLFADVRQVAFGLITLALSLK